MSLNWEGTASDGTEVNGSIDIPEVSHEITLDGLSNYAVSCIVLSVIGIIHLFDVTIVQLDPQNCSLSSSQRPLCARQVSPSSSSRSQVR